MRGGDIAGVINTEALCVAEGQIWRGVNLKSRGFCSWPVSIFTPKLGRSTKASLTTSTTAPESNRGLPCYRNSTSGRVAKALQHWLWIFRLLPNGERFVSGTFFRAFGWRTTMMSRREGFQACACRILASARQNDCPSVYGLIGGL